MTSVSRLVSSLHLFSIHTEQPSRNQKNLTKDEALIDDAPATYYKPPYVGGAGWIGIELDQISDEDLAAHIRAAWRLIAPKKLWTVSNDV
ncbi:MAG: hypothetical protein DMG08_21165 [Acidobacteria bacterium]|nr:MAG: hypothetical protein DMG08_21165 [Acidobacteriota bacterium]